MRAYCRYLHDVTTEKELLNTVTEKVHKLAKGITVSPDQAHEHAMKVFPNIPNFLMNNQPTLGTEAAADDFMDSTEESVLVEHDDNEDLLKIRIDNLTLPAVKWSICGRIVFILVFFALPAIVLALLSILEMTDMNVQLKLMSVLTEARFYNSVTPAFAMHFLYEILGSIDPPDFSDKPPITSLGNNTDSKSQLNYILKLLATITNQINALQDEFDSNSEESRRVKSLMFDSIIKYPYYMSPSEVFYINKTLTEALLDYIVQLSPILNNDNFGAADASAALLTANLLNPMTGRVPIADNINVALDLMILVVKGDNRFIKLQSYILIGAISLIAALVYFVVFYFENKGLISNKTSIYTCLTSLPKNTVSQVTENLKSLSKTICPRGVLQIQVLTTQTLTNRKKTY